VSTPDLLFQPVTAPTPGLLTAGWRRPPFLLPVLQPRMEKPMLVLTRRIGESIIIDGGIQITVVAIQGNKVRLGIVAPDSVRVDRQEVHARRAEFASDASVEIGALSK
jgi:carbon storage regulator